MDTVADFLIQGKNTQVFSNRTNFATAREREDKSDKASELDISDNMSFEYKVNDYFMDDDEVL